MKKRIIIAGMYRSGSTALYNIARLICAQHGETWGAFLDDRMDPGDVPDVEYQILKVHKYHDKRTPDFIVENTVILTSYRHYLEVSESLQRAKDQIPTFEGKSFDLPRYMEWLIYWNSQPEHRYMMLYGKLKRNPKGVIRDVSEALSLPVDIMDIYEQFSRIAPPKSGIDPVTLLHAGHITQKQWLRKKQRANRARRKKR